MYTLVSILNKFPYFGERRQKEERLLLLKHYVIIISLTFSPRFIEEQKETGIILTGILTYKLLPLKKLLRFLRPIYWS